MLLWLPLFSGNALAATISMQMQHGRCHEAAAPQAMAHGHMDAHHQHHADTAPTADEHGPSCSACGVCHLACTGYLGVHDIDLAAVQAPTRETTPFLVVFDSFTSAPLVPPPLVRA